MTRYTRLGKSTHQRVPGEPSSWESLKSTPQKNKNFRFQGKGREGQGTNKVSRSRRNDKKCFGCRQFGHVLSDCPNASAATSVEGSLVEHINSGICFKCGSTEHLSRNCKKKSDKFDYAKCFICTKVGHISRQCPHNKNGIYPGGGECNICKETTHLAKDCPNRFGKAPTSVEKSKDSDPIVSKLSDPFASTEYEPDMANLDKSNQKAKKRKVKF